MNSSFEARAPGAERALADARALCTEVEANMDRLKVALDAATEANVGGALEAHKENLAFHVLEVEKLRLAGALRGVAKAEAALAEAQRAEGVAVSREEES